VSPVQDQKRSYPEDMPDLHSAVGLEVLPVAIHTGVPIISYKK
jgi:hypothetical protein